MADKYVDIDTLKYMLYDVHNLESLLDRKRFADHDKESLDMFLDSTKEFADRELFPYIKEMDEKPAYHKDGQVYVHSQVDKMMKEGGELGFISAPLGGPNGRIVSNGLDVSNKNDKNPTNTIEIMPILKGFRATSLSTLLLKRNPHAARNKIHKNIDPS